MTFSLNLTVLVGLLLLPGIARGADFDQDRNGGCPGDIDGDGDTDQSDLGELLAAWCAHPGDPDWNPNVDLDGDGHVGQGDLGILLADWGCVGVTQLEQLTFTGASFHNVTVDCPSGSCPAYGTPHWLDSDLDGDADDPGDHKYPVAYTRNTYVSIADLRFAVTPADLELEDVPVVGTGPDGMLFAGTGTVSSGELVVTDTLTSDVPLPNTVAYYGTFDIDWKVALDGTSFFPAGVSRNRVYVSYDDPMGDRLESYFDISTQAAHGQDNVEDTIDAIWTEFTDLHVENVRGQVLGYYRGILCASHCTVYDAPGLVMYLNGQCGAWADLLRQCFRTQGIGGAYWITIEPIADEGLLVRNYDFAGEGTSGCAGWPYRLDSPCGGPYWPGGPECTDADGIPGQDEPNPASYFGRHFVVKINGKYYDPSYGAGPYEGTTNEANLLWEQSAIDGYHGYCGPYHAARKDAYEVRETWFSY